MICVCLSQSYSQTQQTQRYIYDNSGNLIAIDTAETDQPPQVLGIQPPLALTSRTGQFIATGTDLLNAVVTSSRTDVDIVTLQTELDNVVFSLQVDAQAELTDIPLFFDTPLGQDNINLPVLPPVSASPVPVILAVDAALPLRIRAERPVAQDTVFDLIINDATVASSVSAITIPAGQLAPVTDPDITGLALGSASASLRLNDFELLNFSIQVVTGQFTPADGDAFASAPIGVSKEPDPDTLALGPFVSGLGVTRLSAPAFGDVFFASMQTTILRGSGLSAVAPDRIMRDSDDVLVTVSGHGLQNVDEVSIMPSESIELGLPDATTDGQSVTFTASIAADAVTGKRSIALAAAGLAVPVITPGIELINITGDSPTIDSISPIIVPTFSEQTLIVRGSNFGDQPTLSILPANGIELDASPQVLADGAVLQANMLVAADAQSGPRVILVTTAAGDSGLTSTPANTLTISNTGQLTEITPLSSHVLGVNKGVVSTEDSGLLGSTLLGVSRGLAVTGLSPQKGEVGQTVLLELFGTGLENVDELLIEPDEGLITGALQANNDRVTMAVDIDPLAPQIPRKVTAQIGGIAVPAAHGADIWEIVPLAPKVGALAPNFVVAGGQPQQISVAGEFLQNAQSIRITPADNILISNLQVIDPNTLNMTITANAAAALGDRLLQVISDTGISSDSLLPNNTLHVVAPEQIVPAVASPILGVLVTSQPQQQSLDAYSTALRIAKAPVAISVVPAFLPRGSSSLIEVTGSGMDTVDEVLILPAENINSSGLSVSANGELLSFMLSVDAVAEPGLRTLQLLSAGQQLAFASPSANLIRIADEQPVIESITPNSGFPGAQFSMTLRGRNLLKASAVLATPAAGISFDSAPLVNADGTEITINVTLTTDAVPGPRLIQVQTPSGTSSDQATPANTFIILEP